MEKKVWLLKKKKNTFISPTPCNGVKRSLPAVKVTLKVKRK